MSPLAGPFFAATVLIGAAGMVKVVAPDGARVALRGAGLPGSIVVARGLGVGEVAVAVAVLAWGGRPGAAAVAVAYAGFAGFASVLHARSRGRASCGCFGGGNAPVTRLHVVVNLALAAVAVAVVVDPVPGIWSTASDTPGAGLAFLGLTLLLAWLLVVALTLLPEVQAATRPGGRPITRAGAGR